MSITLRFFMQCATRKLRADGRNRSAGGQEGDRGGKSASGTNCPRMRARRSWAACSHKRNGMRKATQSAIPTLPPTPALSKPPKSSVGVCMWKRGSVARVGSKEGRDRRRRRTDLEFSPRAFPECPSNRGPVSCPSASLELARALHPPRRKATDGLDESSSEALARPGQDRKTGGLAAVYKELRCQARGKLRTEAEYFEKNAARMRYPSFVSNICSWVRE
jgi:hypothetical protein